jgi:hypothetical protein
MDWVTVTSLVTAAGTLVLAIATFGAVRSANRAARAAEHSLLAGLRPLLMPSRIQDDPMDDFRRLARDLYLPVNDLGYWQGAFRDPSDPGFAEARTAIEARLPLTVDVLYGDYEGGQRVISRFVMMPRDDGRWFASSTRHWNIDRADPR